MAATDLPDEFFTEIQSIFHKNPVFLIGSGFSCGYGLPSMGARCEHLSTLLPTRIRVSTPKHKSLTTIIPFWTRRETPKAEVDLVAAVENMRRQSRDHDN